MFFLIFIFLFITINSDEIKNKHKSESTKNITIKIEDKKHYLNKNDFEEIKEIIDKNFPLLIIKILSGEENMGKKLAFFETSSFNDFSSQCKEYKDMCDYGFAIYIYIHQKLLILEIGKESKKLIDDLYKQRMTDSIRDELSKKNWSQAIKKILLFINYRLTGGKITNFPKQNDYPQIFILTNMIPLFLVLITILTLVFYFGSTEYIFCYEMKLFFDGIILHLGELNKIPENKEKKIEIKNRQCLFCWEPSEGNEYFMHCRHSYHERCLLQWRLHQYACCPCSYECFDPSEVDDDKPVYLTIEDIKILLGLCLDAFRKENIYDYFIKNKEQCEEVKLGDYIWINQKKFLNYSSYRIIYKIYKVLKLMLFFVTFYPEFLKSKKVKLIERLMKMKNKGFFGG